MHIGEICKRSVVTCRRQTSALEIAQLMRDHHVGDVIVVDEYEGRQMPVGIVTDRDLVVQIMAKGVTPELVRAGDMLVGDLVTAVAGSRCCRSEARLPWPELHSRTKVRTKSSDDTTPAMSPLSVTTT
jgi:CBS domain-containing protein